MSTYNCLIPLLWSEAVQDFIFGVFLIQSSQDLNCLETSLNVIRQCGVTVTVFISASDESAACQSVHADDTELFYACLAHFVLLR